MTNEEIFLEQGRLILVDRKFAIEMGWQLLYSIHKNLRRSFLKLQHQDGKQMDPAYIPIVAVIITGLFQILAKIIEILLNRKLQGPRSMGSREGNKGPSKRDSKKDKGNSNKTGSRKKREIIEETNPDKKASRLRKVLDMPFWHRGAILFVCTMLILVFLDSTGLAFRKMENRGTEPCPGRQNLSNNQNLEVLVERGSTAYFMGWGFDGKDGGYFVTFNGRYRGVHTLSNGVYCPSIPTSSELTQKTVDLLIKECQTSQGGCSQKKICSQNILEYYFGGGKCYE